jgi:hypothetical protein
MLARHACIALCTPVSRVLTGQEGDFRDEDLEALHYKKETGLRERERERDQCCHMYVLYLLFISGFIEELHAHTPYRASALKKGQTKKAKWLFGACSWPRKQGHGQMAIN